MEEKIYVYDLVEYEKGIVYAKDKTEAAEQEFIIRYFLG